MSRISKKLLLVFLGVFITFLFVRFIVWQLPGTLADILSDSETNSLDLEALSQQFKASGNFWQPLRDFLQLRWGQSQLYSDDNLPIIIGHFKLTAWLSALSLLFTLGFASAYFLLSARLALRLSNLLLAVPAIVVYPAVVFSTCALTSFCPAGSSLQGRALLLAALAQGFITAPRFFRELEWEVDSIRRKRFILVLRAKGLSQRRIWFRHVLKNALPPVFSLVLLTTLGFVSGAVLVEILFDLPGVGLLLVEAIRSRDLNLIFPLIMFLSLLHLATLQSGRFLKMRSAQHE